MSKEIWWSLLRTVLTALGAFLIGKNIWGQPIDNELWQSIIGVIMAVGSIIWGFFDKSNTLEAVQSALRSVFVVVGGLLIASGKVSAGTLESISGVILAVLPFVYRLLSKQKTDMIAAGTLKPETDIKGVTTLKKVA